MRHLSLVPSRTPHRPAVAGQPALPVHPAQADQAASAGQTEPVAYVPVKLLLAASGRCSCDECCREAIRPQAEQQQPRQARGTDRQPVRNIHLLS